MSVEVHLIKGALPPSEPWRPDGAGAIIRFEGVVRLLEDGRELKALRYQQYPPMTQRELHRLAQAVLEEHDLLAIRVQHSYGDVLVGECSFRAEAAGRHRKETIRAVDVFVDRMKRSVPLWKNPVWKEVEQV